MKGTKLCFFFVLLLILLQFTKSIVINNCDDLALINGDLTGSHELGQDFYCSGTTFTGVTGTFTGTFDGMGFTIYGLSLSIENSAIFQHTDGATIQNLRVQSCSFSGNKAAALVVDAEDSTIRDCLILANTISGSDNVGGVVANSTNTEIENTYVLETTVTGSSNVGGVVGQIDGGSIVQCFNLGFASIPSTTIVSGGDNIGGIAGLVNEQTLLSSCGIANGTVSGTNNVGGITGSLSVSTQQAAHEIIFVCDSVVVSGSSQVGGYSGILSLSSDNTFSIANCSLSGSISASNEAAGIVPSVSTSTSNSLRIVDSLLDPSIFGAIANITFNEADFDTIIEFDNFHVIEATEGTQNFIGSVSLGTNGTVDIVTLSEAILLPLGAWTNGELDIKGEAAANATTFLSERISDPEVCNGYDNDGDCICYSYFSDSSSSGGDLCVAGTGVCTPPASLPSGTNPVGAVLSPITFSNGNVIVQVIVTPELGAVTDVQFVGDDSVCGSVFNPKSTSSWSKSLNDTSSCTDLITGTLQWDGIIGEPNKCFFAADNGVYAGTVKVITTYNLNTTNSLTEREVRPVTVTTEHPYQIVLETEITPSNTDSFNLQLGSSTKTLEMFYSEFSVSETGLVSIVIESIISNPFQVEFEAFEFSTSGGNVIPINAVTQDVPVCESFGSFCRQNITVSFTLDSTRYCVDPQFTPLFTLNISCVTGTNQVDCDNELLLLTSTTIEPNLGSLTVTYCPQVKQIAFTFVSLSLYSGSELVPNDQSAPAGDFDVQLLITKDTNVQFPDGAQFEPSSSSVDSILLVDEANPTTTFDVLDVASGTTFTLQDPIIELNFTLNLSPVTLVAKSITTNVQYIVQVTMTLVYGPGSKKRVTVGVPLSSLSRKREVTRVKETMSVSGSPFKISPTSVAIEDENNNDNNGNNGNNDNSGMSKKNIIIISVVSSVGLLAVVIITVLIFRFVKNRRNSGIIHRDNVDDNLNVNDRGIDSDDI